MQLRTMNLIYESVKEKGGLVIAPSSFAEGFNSISNLANQSGTNSTVTKIVEAL